LDKYLSSLYATGMLLFSLIKNIMSLKISNSCRSNICGYASDEIQRKQAIMEEVDERYD